MRAAFAFSLSVLIAGSAVAQTPNVDINKVDMFAPFIDGNRLYEVCDDPDLRGMCGYYILGVTDELNVIRMAMQLRGNPKTAPCFVSGISGNQLLDVTIKYLRDHPERRHEPANALVTASFAAAFPCPK